MNIMLDKGTFTFTSHLVPDYVGNKAYLQAPFQTPWRTIIVSDKATEILPSKITDVSWIKPQKFIGMSWEIHVGKSNWYKEVTSVEGEKHGANTKNVKNTLIMLPNMVLMAFWSREF